MFIKQVSAILAATVFLSCATLAAAEVGDWYIAPGAIYVDDDEDRGVEDDWAGGELRVGYAFHEHWNIEFFGNTMGLTDDTGGNQDQDLFEFGANLLLVAGRDDALSPYILFGTSLVDTDIDQTSGLGTRPDGENWAFSAGLGVMWNLGDSPFSLRAEYRVRKEASGGDNSINEDFADQLTTIGLNVSLGDRTPKSVDSDGDGVDDNADRCPNTPLGATVDAYGCEVDSDGDGVADSKDECPNTPAGATVDERGCEAKDGDGDGVPDGNDECPNTPAGASVDEKGCELDDDNDGVANSKDRCPNTKPGVRVDVNGCEITEVIELPGVTFETNSDRLVPGAEQVLDDAAATLRKYPDLVVEVAGHTDSDGAAEYNASLSERRAKSVLNYLVDRGANAANLTAGGYGEVEPVADNGTREGKASNRRVELRIQNQ